MTDAQLAAKRVVQVPTHRGQESTQVWQPSHACEWSKDEKTSGYSGDRFLLPFKFRPLTPIS